MFRLTFIIIIYFQLTKAGAECIIIQYFIFQSAFQAKNIFYCLHSLNRANHFGQTTDNTDFLSGLFYTVFFISGIYTFISKHSAGNNWHNIAFKTVCCPVDEDFIKLHTGGVCNVSCGCIIKCIYYYIILFYNCLAIIFKNNKSSLFKKCTLPKITGITVDK